MLKKQETSSSKSPMISPQKTHKQIVKIRQLKRAILSKRAANKASRPSKALQASRKRMKPFLNQRRMKQLLKSRRIRPTQKLHPKALVHLSRTLKTPRATSKRNQNRKMILPMSVLRILTRLQHLTHLRLKPQSSKSLFCADQKRT